MGGCSSSTDEAEMPKLTSSILENKFKTIEKRTFQLPINLNASLEVHSSNGKLSFMQEKSQILSQKMRLLYTSPTSNQICRPRSILIKNFKTKISPIIRIPSELSNIPRRFNGKEQAIFSRSIKSLKVRQNLKI